MHNALCHPGAPCAQPPCVTRAGHVRNALCGVHNALCHLGGPCAQRLVSPGGVLCTTPCVHGVGVHNALCHWKGLCARPCVTERPVRNALCHSGGGACACGLVVRATDFLPVSHGLKSQGGPCAQRLVSGGGPVRNALCRATPCVAQRLVAPGGGAQGLVSQRGLCATPCVTAGAGRVPVAWWVEATDFLPVSHGLKSQGGPVHNALCQGGGLCATPCVTEKGPVHNALCHRGGLCATPCATVSPPAKKSNTGRPRTTHMSSSFRSHPPPQVMVHCLGWEYNDPWGILYNCFCLPIRRANLQLTAGSPSRFA